MDQETEQRLVEFMLSRTSAELDAIVARLRLNPSVLLPRSAAPASRAGEILTIVTRPGGLGFEMLLRVVGPLPDQGSEEGENRVIVVLAANPTTTGSLRIQAEVRVIKEQFDLPGATHKYEVRPQLAARPADLATMMLKEQPGIVHFCGHGDDRGGILLEDESGAPRPVTGTALARLFAAFSGKVGCVVLNACFTAAQADALTLHVHHVVGMVGEIPDASALKFAAGFYRAAAFGCNIARAFELGCAEIDLQGLPGSQVPKHIHADKAGKDGPRIA